MSRPDVEGDAHPRAELYLHAYGESPEAAAVEAHLAQCATCRAE
jgi:predicted anti-sigma-YlaC factor YlaD